MSDSTLTAAHPAAAPPPAAPRSAAPPAGGVRTVARPVAAIALITGPLAMAVSNAGYALATRDGGNDLDGASALALASAQPALYQLSAVAALIACLMLAPAALAAGGLAAMRQPVLGAIGGYAMCWGFICYFGIAFTSVQTLAVAKGGAGLAAYAAASDAASASGAATWVFVVFAAGNLVGTAILATALIVGRCIPLWSALCVLCWPALHVVGLIVGIEWFEVAGALLLAVGFAQVARALPARRSG